MRATSTSTLFDRERSELFGGRTVPPAKFRGGDLVRVKTFFHWRGVVINAYFCEWDSEWYYSIRPPKGVDHRPGSDGKKYPFPTRVGNIAESRLRLWEPKPG